MSATAKNGSEAKFYPNANDTIEMCLRNAKATNDRLGANTILTQETIDRLNIIEPLFKQAGQNIANLKAVYKGLTMQKEKARTDIAMYVSHFVQVFNLGVKRGKYSFTDRALFELDANSNDLPNLKGERNIKQAAGFIISGEARRIAAGEQAVTNPSGAEVEAVYNNFVQLIGLTSNANLALADAQIAMRKLKKEARELVKDVWQEVEHYYRHGTRPRMRKWARKWGVVYARKGGEKVVSGTVLDAATGLPVPAVKVKFENGNNKTISDLQGRFTLVTNLLHKQTLLASRVNYATAKTVIDLKEGEENVCVLKMEKEEE
ncbi:MAG: carboxypeptidase-like regulatory domain-containing protein [Bacteroidota bacterium]